MSHNQDLSALTAQAEHWLMDDPDPQTRAELEQVIAEARESGDTADLADRFSGFLEFGTAGLRGELGAGPARMNRAVVIRAAAGLMGYLKETVTEAPTVVIGFDARYNSDVFAADTAAVVTGAGGRAVLLPEPLPTPVLAFAIQHLGADAGVMVTASHNPPRDNGYKVYLGDGSQIVPPADTGIAGHIAAIDSVASVERPETGWSVAGDEITQAYVDVAVKVLQPDSSREVSLVHTALHGVGSEVLRRAFEQAGFLAPVPVEEQEKPDPAFPTVDFPNPEEPGAIDAALALADQTHPDAVLANDPDADRCAVAVDSPHGWRMLRGDEVGVLLGHHVLQSGRITDDRNVFARSIVSSRLLGAMAKAAGIPSEQTLTGFKWIGRVPGLAYGYEEALGYCVDPANVPDKDGITAALLVAELVAEMRVKDKTLLDVLDQIALEHGVYATEAFSVRVTDLSLISAVMDRLISQTPTEVAGVSVAQADDLSEGSDGIAPTPGLRLTLADETRVIVRPSGTEPKLKVYIEVIEPVSGAHQLSEARSDAAQRVEKIKAAMQELTTV